MGKWAIFGTFRFTFLGPLVDRNNNTYLFVRPGPCLIEWYMYDVVVSIFLRREPCKNETLLYQMGGARHCNKATPPELWVQVRCDEA